MEALARSKVERVHLVGRRGPLQAAFTIKELREMLKLPNVQTCWRKDDFTGKWIRNSQGLQLLYYNANSLQEFPITWTSCNDHASALPN